ncbi:MAG TPA: LptF/LptG family permease [Ohtaekwangia sp.]|uniref:LptF/LptG family permease n=1 Tax=Ohtaekwangia sp. TaxID=2066019 RepID=UPI002F943E23
MKRIDKLVLGAFIGPFLITFLVVVFILLNVNMLKYFDDIIGKGLDYWTLGQLFFHFAVFTVPTALPLAVLLSSLIAFGNLGEHFELTAIKASGVSLVRALLPIFIFVLGLTVVAFYANNDLVPKAALEAYSLLYDIKQKKPALDLREGAFYNGINDISIKVNKKFPDGITLKDVIVYDHRKNDGNKEVTIADSGRMQTILNERYLKFELFNGFNYTEGASNEREVVGQKRNKNPETLSRSKFDKTQVVFDLSSFQMDRTDKKWFQNNRIMRNLSQLDGDIDSVSREVMGQRLTHYLYRPSYFSFYFRKDTLIMPREVLNYKRYRDSINSLPYRDKMKLEPQPVAQQAATPPPVIKKEESKKEEPKKAESQPVARKADTDKKPNTHKTAVKRRDDRDFAKLNTVKKKPVRNRSRSKPKPKKVTPVIPAVPPKKIILSDSAFQAKVDSIFLKEPAQDVWQGAANMARQVKSQVQNANTSIDNYTTELRIFEIQWHKIFASSFACIAMFLIGAPLGAIIKRGGLGVPFLVSILFFIVYYVLTMQGEKLAKQGSLSIPAGVWMADVLLFITGMFFLRQARIDARLFEADFYSVAADKVKRWFTQKRKQNKVQPV